MKKSIFSYFSYLVLLLLAVGTLSSCDETETVDPAPFITVTPDGATIDVGQSVQFAYTVSSDIELTEVRIEYPNQADQVNTPTGTSYSGSYTVTGQFADAGSDVIFTIVARDVNGNVGRKDVTVSINDAAPVAFASSVAVILAGQDVANQGSFADVNGTTVTVYTLAQAKANSATVDIAYLQGGAAASQGAVIGSPRDASVASVYNSAGSGVQTWTTRNNTRFRNTSLTKANFDAITDGSLITAAYTTGTQPAIPTGDQSENSTSRVNQLTVGTVFAFRTADGKDAVAHVAAITPGNTGSITLDVKVVR